MRVICSYCRRELGTKEPLIDERVSHAMCKECFQYFQKQWEGLRLGEYLDRFEAPVMAVDGPGRVVAANESMAELLGKSQRELFGLLGGEAMECVHARLPAGCGQTEHCRTCTIRIAVTGTLETGEPKVRMPAYLDQTDRRLRLWISTEIRDGAVVVAIEDIVATAVGSDA